MNDRSNNYNRYGDSPRRNGREQYSGQPRRERPSEAARAPRSTGRSGNRAANDPWVDSFPDFDDSFDDEWADVGSLESSPSLAAQPGQSRPVQDDDLFEDDFDDEPCDTFEDDFDDDFDDAVPPAPVVEQRRPDPEPRRQRPQPDEYRAAPAPRRSAQSDSWDDLWGEPEAAPAPSRPRPQRRQAPPPPSRPVKAQLDLFSKILIAVLALVCVASSLLISAGSVIDQPITNKTQRSAYFDLKQGFDLISSNVINSINGLPKVYVLPMNESSSPEPREDGYSSYIDDDGDEHQVYTDETITVDCSRKRYAVGEYNVTAAVARIKISHPTQIRSAFAGGEYSATMREKPSEMASRANAVVALNGEMYNYVGNDNLLIRNGTTYREYSADTSYSFLFIDSKGDFIIEPYDLALEKGILTDPENPIYHTVYFGPQLVVNGEVRHFNFSEITNYGSRNPRSALGQTGPLEYVFVAVEGRTATSKGLSMDYLADLMLDLGCTQAYNVDGGQSSMLIFHDKLYNQVSNGGERSFSDIIYFASALPEE